MINATPGSQPAQATHPQPTSRQTPAQPATPPAGGQANASQQPESELDTLKEKINFFFDRYFTKIVAIVLTLQGLWGIYNSVKFILVDYPLLEQQLAVHQVTQDQVNFFANKAILMIFSTVLSMFFALRITVIQSTVAKRVNTAIGILMVIGNANIQNFLVQIGSRDLLTNVLLNGIRAILNIEKEVKSTLPEIPPELVQ